jgi:hypothetical protein
MEQWNDKRDSIAVPVWAEDVNGRRHLSWMPRSRRSRRSSRLICQKLNMASHDIATVPQRN